MSIEDFVHGAAIGLLVGIIVGFTICGKLIDNTLIKNDLAHYEVNPKTGEKTLKYQCSACGFTGKAGK